MSDVYTRIRSGNTLKSMLPTSVLWLNYFGWNMTIHRKESSVLRRKLLKW